MRNRFLIVHNPIAGIAGRSLRHRLIAALRARGAVAVEAPTNAQGPDLKDLEGGAFDAVIAAGGDGTFRALAKAIGERFPIGFLPMGTGNVLAHEIALPKDPSALAALYTDGPEVRIEGARANGEPFFLMAGAGFDGEVVRRLSTPLKRRIGKAAYVPPVLAALGKGEPALEVLVDGKLHSAGFVVVTKARRYGGAFTIARNTSLQSEGLQAVLFSSQSRSLRLAQLLALAAGAIDRAPGVVTIPCRTVEVSSNSNVAVQIDGDDFGWLPLLIETNKPPRARLIVPAAALL